MEMLVRDMLDISLIESDRLFLRPTRCDLVEICQQVLKVYTVGAGLELSFTSTEDVLEVEVDRERISQVLINLLFIARKCSPRGSPITVMLQQAGDEAVITVIDTEEMRPEETIPEPFAQIFSRTETANQAGTPANSSLGLYLTRKIVECHGGHVEVQNDRGMRCAFSIFLPLPEPAAAESAEDSKQTKKIPALFQPPQWLIS
jgi:signal transduction histidine kinase